jgi:mono/diheme cytochrome c family protein
MGYSKLRLTGCLLALTSLFMATVGDCDDGTTVVSESSIGGVIKVPVPASAADRGHLVFQKWCAGCHAPEYVPTPSEAAGLPAPLRSPLGTFKLRQRYGDTKPAVLEQRTDLTGQLITIFVRHGAGLMPAFRKTEVSDAELQNLIAYLSPPSPIGSSTKNR